MARISSLSAREIAAEKLAPIFPLGRAIKDAMPQYRDALATAAKAGKHPVPAITPALIKEFGTHAFENDSFKRFTALLIHIQLNHAGYYGTGRVIFRTTKDPIFKSFASFHGTPPKRQPRRRTKPASMLERFVHALTSDEFAELKKIVSRRENSLVTSLHSN